METNFVITSLTPELKSLFCACLTPDDPNLKETGTLKEDWLSRQDPADYGVRIALTAAGIPAGMIQYLPAENSPVEGAGLWFVFCVWIPDGKRNPAGRQRKKGMGRALLEAAEQDVKNRGARGLAAWGVTIPAFMRSAWFRKRGYRTVEKKGIMELLWKPFYPDARPPRWRKPEGAAAGNTAGDAAGPVRITARINGICPAMNLVHERFRRAAKEFGGRVVYETIDNALSDAVSIDGRNFPMGPPSSYDRIVKTLRKAVKKGRRR